MQIYTKEAVQTHNTWCADKAFRNCKLKHESNYYQFTLLELVYRIRLYPMASFTRISQIIIPCDTRASLRMRMDWLACLMRNEKSNVDDVDARDICDSETSNKLCAVLSSVKPVSNNKPSTRAKFSHYPLT